MLENFVEPITYLQVVKKEADLFKIQTGTDMTYYQYSELFLSDATNHDNKLNGTLSLALNPVMMSIRLDS